VSVQFTDQAEKWKEKCSSQAAKASKPKVDLMPDADMLNVVSLSGESFGTRGSLKDLKDTKRWQI